MFMSPKRRRPEKYLLSSRKWRGFKEALIYYQTANFHSKETTKYQMNAFNNQTNKQTGEQKGAMSVEDGGQRQGPQITKLENYT